MKYEHAALLILAGLLNQPAFAAQAESAEAPNAANTGAADGARNSDSTERSPALTGVRHPLYRLNKSDVVEIKFTFSPEFDQSATVQPDGFLALKAVGDLFVEGLSISEVRDSVTRLYRPMLRDPDISVILRDFDKPYFIDETLRRSAAQIARARVEENYLWEKVVTEVNCVYADLMRPMKIKNDRRLIERA